MRQTAPSAKRPSSDWQAGTIGKRLPSTLRHARDLATARRIVTAAEEIFAEQGLDGARMDVIARAAKVNKALLYYYFRSKEELHRFVLDALFSQLSAGVGEMGPDLTAAQRLAAIVDHFFAFVQQHPNYPRLMQRALMGRGADLDWIVSEYTGPLLQRLMRTIKDGISAGEFRRVDVRNTALTVVSLMVFYFGAAPVISRVLGRDALLPAEVRKRRLAVHDFLEHGLSRTRLATR